MAHLEIAQDWLHIRLGMYEKVLTVHGSLTVNLTHIRKVDPHPKAPEAVDLVNFSGTYVPGRVVAGTETTRGDREIFYDVRALDESIAIHLDHDHFERLVVQVDNGKPEDVAEWIESAAREARARAKLPAAEARG
ncbi:MAG: hypothetical protein KC543_15410 [Myxococcales bacterium]|nr:hypothetical protein [Myxococcales bacterium]